MATNHNPKTAFYNLEWITLSAYEPAETSTSRPCREEVAALWALEKKLGEAVSDKRLLEADAFCSRMGDMLSLAWDENMRWDGLGYESPEENLKDYMASGELDVVEDLEFALHRISAPSC